MWVVKKTLSSVHRELSKGYEEIPEGCRNLKAGCYSSIPKNHVWLKSPSKSISFLFLFPRALVEILLSPRYPAEGHGSPPHICY